MRAVLQPYIKSPARSIAMPSATVAKSSPLLLSPPPLLFSSSHSDPMYVCAICRVSNFDSRWSAPSDGTTSRSLSNASFRPFMRRRSRAFAASRRRFITTVPTTTTGAAAAVASVASLLCCAAAAARRAAADRLPAAVCPSSDSAAAVRALRRARLRCGPAAGVWPLLCTLLGIDLGDSG